ncbi:MAG: glycosyltransferase family 39 protein [Polyangiaceae bacterium]
MHDPERDAAEPPEEPEAESSAAVRAPRDPERGTPPPSADVEASSPPDVAGLDGNEKRLARWLLAVMVAMFTGFAALYVHRLSNFMLGDMEFTGWVGPIAERFGGAERPYIDFVLPIPPGSFLLLRGIQLATGKALLLQELWVAAIAHLLMGLLGYAMARPLVGRLNALLVSIGTLVIVLQIHKECAYDHTAQLMAWSSLVLGLHASLSGEDRRRQLRLWAASGVCAGLTLLFKQSTGVGVIAGWLVAHGYFAVIRWLRRVPITDRRVAMSWAGGLAVGVALTAGVVLAIGSTLGAFWQAVFSDGAELKGGRYKLVFNLFSYVFRHDAYPASFFFSMLLVAVLLRWLKLRGNFDLHRPASEPLDQRAARWIGGALIAVFGLAIVLLIAQVRETWGAGVFWLKQTQNIPAFGLFFGCVVFVGQLRSNRSRTPVLGHQLNGFTLAVLATSLLHNASFPGLRPFYDNNPIIPLAFVFICIALERARLRWVKWASFGLVLLGLLGPKFHRALSDGIYVGHSGHWAGLYVNERGAEVVRAALRVRELAKPDDSVLVLPEDVEFRRLVDRPRPPVLGAILFVDQYPKRLVEHDIRAIDAHLPKVIVIHPRQERLWKVLFDLWSTDSGTARLMRHVRDDLLPKYYRRDSSFRTVFFRERALMDIYVRRDDVESAPSP